MKLLRLRQDDVLDDGGITLVRGGEFDPDVLRADAMRYHAIYGSYGISVFATGGATLDEMAQQVPLVRFARLTLITVAAVRGAGPPSTPPSWSLRAPHLRWLYMLLPGGRSLRPGPTCTVSDVRVQIG
jgi:hypothetical protein